MDDHDDSMVDALVGGDSLSSRDILKWSEGVSVHVPDLSDIRERTERSLDMRELNSALNEVDSRRLSVASGNSAHSFGSHTRRVSSPLAQVHYSEAHAPTLDALEGRNITASPEAAGPSAGGSSTAGHARRTSSARNSLRNSLRDSLHDSLRHSLRQSLREGHRESRRDSGGLGSLDGEQQQQQAQALRTSTNTNGASGVGTATSTPSSLQRSVRSSYRERLENEVPLSLRKSPASSTWSPLVRRNALESPVLRHARRGSSPFLSPCAPEASMLDATFHPSEIGDRTYDALETAVTTNANRRKTMGLHNLRALVAESEARLSPSPSPAAPTFPFSGRLDVPDRSPAIMDKSTFIRRIREESESPMKESSLLDAKSFAMTPPQEKRDTLAPLPPSTRGSSRFAQPAAPRFQESESPMKESSLLDAKSFALTPPQEKRDALAPLPPSTRGSSRFAQPAAPRFQPDQTTNMSVDLGRLVKKHQHQEASLLPAAVGELADLSIDSDDEFVPASLRPRPLPASASNRNLAKAEPPKSITEQLREREQQRELARARSHARLNSMASMRSLASVRTPRKGEGEGEVPVSLRKPAAEARDRPSAPPVAGRRSNMAPPVARSGTALARGPLGVTRSASARDLALGTGPTRLSAPATTDSRRTLPPSEGLRRQSALPASASSRRLSALPSASDKDRRLSAVPSVSDNARRPPTTSDNNRRLSAMPRTESTRRLSALPAADDARRSSAMPADNARRSSAMPTDNARRLSTLPTSESRRLSTLPSTESTRNLSTLTRRRSVLPARTDSRAAAEDRNQPSRSSTVSRADSTSSRRKSVLPRSDSQAEREPARSTLQPRDTEGRRSALLSRANSSGTTSRRQSVLPRPESREPRLRPSASTLQLDRRAGLPTTASSRNLAASPTKRLPTTASSRNLASPTKRASAPAAAREVLGARRSLAPAPSATLQKRRSMLPPKLPATQPTQTTGAAHASQATQAPQARTRSETNSASSSVPSLCSAPTIDSKLSAPPSDFDQTPAPRSWYGDGVEYVQPPPSSYHKGFPDAQSLRPPSRPENRRSGSYGELGGERGYSTLKASTLSWNDSLSAPIRNGHVEEMRHKYTQVDEMGRAMGERRHVSSTVGSVRRLR